jgi:hypothetical protein
MSDIGSDGSYLSPPTHRDNQVRTRQQVRSDAPPSYDASALSRRSSAPSFLIFNFLRMLRSKQPCITNASPMSILSGIRYLVTGPNFTPSSVGPIVNSCAAAFPSADFSDLLQSLNIDCHMAMYRTRSPEKEHICR